MFGGGLIYPDRPVWTEDTWPEVDGDKNGKRKIVKPNPFDTTDKPETHQRTIVLTSSWPAYIVADHSPIRYTLGKGNNKVIFVSTPSAKHFRLTEMVIRQGNTVIKTTCQIVREQDEKHGNQRCTLNEDLKVAPSNDSSKDVKVDLTFVTEKGYCTEEEACTLPSTSIIFQITNTKGKTFPVTIPLEVRGRHDQNPTEPPNS